MKEELKELGFKNYGAYLKSEHWLTIRKGYGEGKCTVCDSDESLNLHHKHYNTLGAEQAEDLVLLCRSCHQKFHGVRRCANREPITIYLNEEEKLKLKDLKVILSQKTLSSAVRALIRVYHLAFSDRFGAEDYL